MRLAWEIHDIQYREVRLSKQFVQPWQIPYNFQQMSKYNTVWRWNLLLKQSQAFWAQRKCLGPDSKLPISMPSLSRVKLKQVQVGTMAQRMPARNLIPGLLCRQKSQTCLTPLVPNWHLISSRKAYYQVPSSVTRRTNRKSSLTRKPNQAARLRLWRSSRKQATVTLRRPRTSR